MSTPSKPAEVRVFGSRPTRRTAGLNDAWRQRGLLPYFGRRFNEKRYLRTWLGPAWLVLQPAMTLGWQLFVFVAIAQVGSDSSTPFPLRLLLGFAVWNLFSETAFWATRSLELNRKVLGSVRIAGLVVVVAALAPAIVDALVAMMFFVIGLIVYWAVEGQVYIHPSAATALVPAGLLMLVLLGLAVGLLLSVPGAQARDVRFGLRFVLAAWYFVTPVVYPLGSVPQLFRPLVEFNPVTGAVTLVVNGVLGTGPPSVASIMASAVGSVVAFAVGLTVFLRHERRVLDVT